MDFYRRTKRYSIEKFTTSAFSLLANASTENLIRLTYLAEKIPQKESYREKSRWIRTLFQTDHPGLAIARRVLRETNPHHREKIISNFIVNQLLMGTNRRKAFEAERGFYPPNAMILSPTMRCNLNCYGCYSGSYPQEDLPFEVIDRVVGECKEMGIHLVLMTGGEPFLRKDQFDRITKVMDWLKEAGIFFAISTTQTSKNTDILTSDEFIDFLIEKGCILLWNFHYLPIGRAPDLSLMTTPEQRNRTRERYAYFRATKPILMGHFWHDGCLTHGCIAGGGKYFHVNARGDVEPCVFCPFASDNVKEKSL